MDRNLHSSQYFPINEASTHPDSDCEECHPNGSYTTFSCLGCHEHSQSTMDPAHSSIDGYAYASDTCLECHPTGEAMRREEHNAYFPITYGDHSGYACSECHEDSSNYETFTCINCHSCSEMDREHADEGIRNYECDDDKCYSCHPDGQED